MITVDPNKTCYVFDVDGTLTEPRVQMTDAMANEFLLWSMNKECFIATGSDFEKTKEQVPWDVMDCFQNIFCCMGNEVRNTMGRVIYKSDFAVPEPLRKDFAKILQNSNCPVKTGAHTELRTGMVNFSTVGRNADFEQRKTYSMWDKKHDERNKIVSYINEKYPTLNASVGGSISIDIIEEGHDKGQIVHYLENAGATKIVFVGDKCTPGGNDHGVVRELKKSNLAYEWYNVSGPSDTLMLLRTNKVFDGGR
jgi:HAD superfamily hydrolase (TIGR01484 family)